MRLTDKTSVEFTPECSKVNPLTTQGKCTYYEKLREFEYFMEEQGFEDLEHLKLRLKNLSYGAKYYAFWEKLKEYIEKSIESDNKYLKSFPNNMNFENYRTAKRVILETMKELEE